MASMMCPKQAAVLLDDSTIALLGSRR